MFGTVLQSLAFIVLLTTTNFTILIGSITVLGMISTIRVQVATLYAYEMMRKVHWSVAFTSIAVIDALSILLASIYFSFVSNDWFSLIYGCIVSNVLAAIVSLFLPESPRFLISTGQLDKAQKAFDTIARVNRIALPSKIVSQERIQ